MKTEARIQQEIVKWFRNNYCLAHHDPRCLILSIPNEQKPNLTKTGMLPGAADLLIIADGTPIFVEVKTEKGRQSEKQEKFQHHAAQAGAHYYLVRSLEEFQSIFEPIKTITNSNTKPPR